jgi:hypothetical protein
MILIHRIKQLRNRRVRVVSGVRVVRVQWELEEKVATTVGTHVVEEITAPVKVFLRDRVVAARCCEGTCWSRFVPTFW